MKVVIFNDEQFSSARLQQLLQQINPNLQILAVLNDEQEGVHFLRTALNEPGARPHLFARDMKLRLLGQRGRNKYPISMSSIAYCYIEDRIVWLVKKDGSHYMLNKTMDELEHLLDGKYFFRVNRKIIIAHNTLEKMNTLKKSKIKLWLNPTSSFEVIVPSAKSSRFKKWLCA